MLPLQVVVNRFTIQLEEVEELVCRASSQVCFLATSWHRVCLLLLIQTTSCSLFTACAAALPNDIAIFCFGSVVSMLPSFRRQLLVFENMHVPMDAFWT